MLVLPDGRRLSYRQFGTPDGLPLLALHGTPGSRLKFALAGEIAQRQGIRLIAPDRWGYGATDRHLAPSLPAYAHDMVALLGHLDIERFAILGVSGGGPYAAAVAAMCGDRVAALALAAPVGPIAGEADVEMTAFHRFCFGGLARSPSMVAAVFGAFRAILGLSPGLAMRIAMLRAAPADRHLMARADIRDRLGATFVEGLRPGAQGPVCDLALFGRPWQVDLESVRAPSRLWLGTVDRNVPLTAARRLAERIPGCALVELPGEGHMWVADNYATVLEWISGTQTGHTNASAKRNF